jgi:phage tail-like protein
MSSLQPFDTGTGWSFGVTIDGVTFKDITEIDGVKLELDEIEYKANTPDGKYVNKRLPGRKKAGEITITRGVTDDKGWQTWIKDVFNGNVKSARQNGEITVYNYMDQPVMQFQWVNGWPKALEYGSFKAGDTSVMTEKVTIVHEGLEPSS